MSAPQWLRAQLRSHNRHAFGLAVLSLASALLAWNLAYFFFMLLLLGLHTVIHGGIGAEKPGWISTLAIGLTIVLFVWGWIDEARRRYDGVSDRGIIGWHLIGDFLLLPVRLTYAIWGNFAAIRRLSRADLGRAWELLAFIQRHGKGYLHSLALIEPDSNTLFRLVTALQMLDLIDLHRGEGNWFYTVRSTRLEQVGNLLASAG
jgi:hypothetical protein